MDRSKEGLAMATTTQAGAPQFPVFSAPASSREAMDEAIRQLHARKDAWVAVPVRERIAIVDRLMHDFAAVAPRWVAACCQAKGIALDSPGASEEWGGGALTLVRHLRQTHRALGDIAREGRPRIPGPVKTRPDGQVTAGVFPQTGYEKILFTGLTAEVWMEPGVTAEELPATQAVAYSDKQHPGKVALVLGAGNVSAIAPLDVLYKLFVEDQVALLKTNPVNAYLGPLIEESFRALVEPGYLRVVYGGAEEGAYLCNHPDVDEIHITGSDKTFDAIVFGTGPEGAARKAARQPILHKRITGELGNVSPVIVVPGPWSASDLAYQAEHLTSMLTNNAGYNCNATRVILQHADWSLREKLLQDIQDVLRKVPTRMAYYPGARDRYQAFVAVHPETVEVGVAQGEELPWALIPGVNPDNMEDVAFTTEAFCSLFAETALPAASVAEYVDRAVDFCNDKIYGTLNVTIIVHPRSLKDRAVAEAVERAVANLRYGTVAVNYWAGTGFSLGTTTWGAFPGHQLGDIQSGTGVVHNTLMFSRPQKSVMRSPFRMTPTPPWFATRGRAGREVFRRMTYLEVSPSPAKVPAIAVAALRG
jgi:acyl-CoA reductase-like NAD-dependent aldehyde dehydrogenase